MRSPLTWKTALVLGLILLASFVRFWGLGWGLPNTYHIDENKFAGTALHFFGGDLNPHFFHVPTLHMYSLAGLWKVYYWVGRVNGTFHDNSQFINYFIDHPATYYLIGRALSAVLSIGTILLLYFIGLRMYNRTVGLLAAVFLTFSLEHTTTSHAMMPDAPMVFFMVLAFYFVWRVYEEGRPRDYILAGLAAGLAMAMKYGGQMMFLPLFLAHVFRIFEKNEPKKRILLYGPLYLSGLVFLAVFLLGCPYALLDFKTFARDFKWQANHLLNEGHFGDSPQHSAWLFYLQYGFRDNVGRWAQFLAFGAMIATVVRRKPREIILLSYPVVQFLMIAGWKTRATRYFLFMAPFFILAAAWFADRAGRWLAARWTSGRGKMPWAKSAAIVFPLALGAVAVAPSALQTLRYDRSIAGPETRTQAKSWIEFNLPPGAKVALESYGPPFSRGVFSIIYEHALGNRDLDALARDDKAEFVVISEAMAGRFISDPKTFPGQSAFYRELDAEATLVKSFASSYTYDLDFLHNPLIRIYRLSRTPNFRFPGHYLGYAQDLRLVRTAGKGWRLDSSIRARGWIEAGERVRLPYVRITDAAGREIARLLLSDGEAPAGADFEAANSADLPPLPEGARIFIGYEYRLWPNPLREPPEHPYKKEFELPESLDAAALRDGRFSAVYRYGTFPSDQAGGYVQSLVVIRRGGPSASVWSSVFGGALKAGDSFVESPYVELEDADGRVLERLDLFAGRAGSFGAERSVPLDQRAILAALPESFRVVIGHRGTGSKGHPLRPPAALELEPAGPAR
ncbi:MAG: glycosyltransferase family 39 protein [Candidatus Aminicenantales bacterium]|jgi:4-amino-4-deoxy-L-arabinose transferase-like glycosyltransferase